MKKPITREDVTHEFIALPPPGVYLFHHQLSTVTLCYGEAAYYRIPLNDYKYSSDFLAKERLRKLCTEYSGEKKLLRSMNDVQSPAWENVTLQLERIAQAEVQKHTDTMHYYVVSGSITSHLAFHREEVHTRMQKSYQSCLATDKSFAYSYGYQNIQAMMRDNIAQEVFKVFSPEELNDLRKSVFKFSFDFDTRYYRENSYNFLKTVHSHLKELWEDIESIPCSWVKAALDPQELERDTFSRLM